MSSKPYILERPADVAMRYGNDKKKIQQAAMIGAVNPTDAVLAGMFIDRVVQDAQAAKANELTVAQETFPQMAPQMAMAPQMGGQMPAEAGVAALPVPDEMVPNEFAGGGIVAFANGGDTSPFGRFMGYDTTRRLQDEQRLRDQIRNQFGMAAGPFGFFKTQTDEERARAQDIVGRLDKMSVPEMQQILGIVSPTEAIIAQAERGEGPNVSRPSGINRLPQGLTPEDTPFGATPPPAAGGPAGGMPKILSAEDQLKRIAELNKAAGVSEDPDAPIREMLERQRGESKEARKEANAMALIAAGLGIAGGDSPYALQNLKGAIPALQQLGVDKRDIRKLDRESDKVEADLARAADARKRGNVDKAIELEDKSFNREMNMRRTIAAEISAKKPAIT